MAFYVICRAKIIAINPIKKCLGAVDNEAMSYKLCLVRPNKIGAVSYLVKDSFNGMVFKPSLRIGYINRLSIYLINLLNVG